MTAPLQSDTLALLGAALAEAQGELQHAAKQTAGQIGQNRNYKYADLATVLDTIRPTLAAHGLATMQRPMPCSDGVVIQTMLVHKSGEWIADGGLHVPAAKHDAQGFGSAMTYARRYGLLAMVGIATEDDDGAAATAAPRDAATINAEQVERIVQIAEAAGWNGEANRVKARRFTPAQYPAAVASYVKGALEAASLPCEAAGVALIAERIVRDGNIDALSEALTGVVA